MFGNWKVQVNNTFNTFLVFILSAVIDAIYILVVVLFNVGVDWFVKLLKPVGLTYWMFLITQILLGLLSLYNIVIYVYSDMRIVFMRSKKMITRESRKNEEEEL
jgi:hypothetical protein